MSLKVVFENILIQPIADESKIVVSDDVYTPVKGEVVAMGSGTPSHPMQVRVGMNVLFYKTDARRIEDNGEEYYVLSQRDILAYEDD